MKDTPFIRHSLRTIRAITLAVSALAVGEAKAWAYCRSTTCDGDCGQDENGCKTQGAPLFWRSGCVGFSFQKDGTQWMAETDYRPPIEDAFAAWTELQCASGGISSLAFAKLPDVDCHEAEYNESDGNANIVLFQDNQWHYTAIDNTLAKTTVSFDNETGEIFDADIEINSANNGFTVDNGVGDCNADNDCYDLASVLTHEVGHLIGLDHSRAMAATMNASYARTTKDLRSLEQDDMDAACAAYPPGRNAVCDTTPTNGFSSECFGGAENSNGCSISTTGGDSKKVSFVHAVLLVLLMVNMRRRT